MLNLGGNVVVFLYTVSNWRKLNDFSAKYLHGAGIMDKFVI